MDTSVQWFIITLISVILILCSNSTAVSVGNASASVLTSENDTTSENTSARLLGNGHRQVHQSFIFHWLSRILPGQGTFTGKSQDVIPEYVDNNSVHPNAQHRSKRETSRKGKRQSGRRFYRKKSHSKKQKHFSEVELPTETPNDPMEKLRKSHRRNAKMSKTNHTIPTQQIVDFQPPKLQSQGSNLSIDSSASGVLQEQPIFSATERSSKLVNNHIPSISNYESLLLTSYHPKSDDSQFQNAFQSPKHHPLQSPPQNKMPYPQHSVMLTFHQPQPQLPNEYIIPVPNQYQSQPPKHPVMQIPAQPQPHAPKESAMLPSQHQSEMHVPQQPHSQVPKKPIMQIPLEPHSQTPKEPLMKGVQHTAVQIPQQPQKQVPKQPVFQVSHRPELQPPQMPISHGIQQPLLQRPKEHIILGPHMPRPQLAQQSMFQATLSQPQAFQNPTSQTSQHHASQNSRPHGVKDSQYNEINKLVDVSQGESPRPAVKHRNPENVTSEYHMEPLREQTFKNKMRQVPPEQDIPILETFNAASNNTGNHNSHLIMESRNSERVDLTINTGADFTRSNINNMSSGDSSENCGHLKEVSSLQGRCRKGGQMRNSHNNNFIEAKNSRSKLCFYEYNDSVGDVDSRLSHLRDSSKNDPDAIMILSKKGKITPKRLSPNFIKLKRMGKHRLIIQLNFKKKSKKSKKKKNPHPSSSEENKDDDGLVIDEKRVGPNKKPNGDENDYGERVVIKWNDDKSGSEDNSSEEDENKSEQDDHKPVKNESDEDDDEDDDNDSENILTIAKTKNKKPIHYEPDEDLADENPVDIYTISKRKRNKPPDHVKHEKTTEPPETERPTSVQDVETTLTERTTHPMTYVTAAPTEPEKDSDEDQTEEIDANINIRKKKKKSKKSGEDESDEMSTESPTEPAPTEPAPTEPAPTEPQKDSDEDQTEEIDANINIRRKKKKSKKSGEDESDEMSTESPTEPAPTEPAPTEPEKDSDEDQTEEIEANINIRKKKKKSKKSGEDESDEMSTESEIKPTTTPLPIEEGGTNKPNDNDSIEPSDEYEDTITIKKKGRIEKKKKKPQNSELDDTNDYTATNTPPSNPTANSSNNERSGETDENDSSNDDTDTNKNKNTVVIHKKIRKKKHPKKYGSDSNESDSSTTPMTPPQSSVAFEDYEDSITINKKGRIELKKKKPPGVSEDGMGSESKSDDDETKDDKSNEVERSTDELPTSAMPQMTTTPETDISKRKKTKGRPKEKDENSGSSEEITTEPVLSPNDKQKKKKSPGVSEEGMESEPENDEEDIPTNGDEETSNDNSNELEHPSDELPTSAMPQMTTTPEIDISKRKDSAKEKDENSGSNEEITTESVVPPNDKRKRKKHTSEPENGMDSEPGNNDDEDNYDNDDDHNKKNKLQITKDAKVKSDKTDDENVSKEYVDYEETVVIKKRGRRPRNKKNAELPGDVVPSDMPQLPPDSVAASFQDNTLIVLLKDVSMTDKPDGKIPPNYVSQLQKSGYIVISVDINREKHLELEKPYNSEEYEVTKSHATEVWKNGKDLLISTNSVTRDSLDDSDKTPPNVSAWNKNGKTVVAIKSDGDKSREDSAENGSVKDENKSPDNDENNSNEGVPEIVDSADTQQEESVETKRPEAIVTANDAHSSDGPVSKKDESTEPADAKHEGTESPDAASVENVGTHGNVVTTEEDGVPESGHPQSTATEDKSGEDEEPKSHEEENGQENQIPPEADSLPAKEEEDEVENVGSLEDTENTTPPQIGNSEVASKSKDSSKIGDSSSGEEYENINIHVKKRRKVKRKNSPGKPKQNKKKNKKKKDPKSGTNGDSNKSSPDDVVVLVTKNKNKPPSKGRNKKGSGKGSKEKKSHKPNSSKSKGKTKGASRPKASPNEGEFD